MEDPQGLELTGTNWPTQTTTPPTTMVAGNRITTLRVHYTVQDQPQHQPPNNRVGVCTARQDVSVVIAGEPRPAPFRTRKLRPPAPMVLHPPGCGRVGHRRAHNQRKGRRPHTTPHDGGPHGVGPPHTPQTPTPPRTPTRQAGLPHPPHQAPHTHQTPTPPHTPHQKARHHDSFPSAQPLQHHRARGIGRQVRGRDRGPRPC